MLCAKVDFWRRLNSISMHKLITQAVRPGFSFRLSFVFFFSAFSHKSTELKNDCARAKIRFVARSCGFSVLLVRCFVCLICVKNSMDSLLS